MHVYDRLMEVAGTRGAGHLVLLDPDTTSVEESVAIARACEDHGVDGLLIGGSLLFSGEFDAFVKAVGEAVSIPVILFPGSGRQLSGHADGVLFLSILSGRNAHHLIGEQVRAAPVVHALGLDAVPTAYMLVESGKTTSAEFMSDTRPLPRDKAEIAVAHGLAAEYLGFKLIYLEAGSGAEHSVPEEMIGAFRKRVNVPVIVGGGIRTPEEAGRKVEAGASFVVTGSVFEDADNLVLLKAFADAIHARGRTRAGR